MTGMGELFHNLNAHFDSVDGVMAVDFSEEMCAKARLGALRSPQLSCRIMEADALNSPIESGSADCVYCSFGLKTLSESQQRAFAAEVARILKPGGKFSFIEISVPTNRFFKFLFLFYLRYVIPLVGRMLLGNPSNYRMLAYYTEAFNNSSFFQNCLQQENLETQSFRHFFGSATGVYGAKNDHR